MGIEIGRVIEELKKQGFSQGAQVLSATVSSLEDTGLIPHELQNGSTPEAASELETEWNRQVDKFVELGFHNVLKLSEEKYRESLPKFEAQPEEYKGRFDVPVLVETRIPARKQVKLAGIRDFLGGLKGADWKDPRGIKTPKKPYGAWLQDGSKYLDVSVDDVRKRLDGDEVADNLFDATALVIAYPEILDKHSIDVPGARVGSVRAPFFDRWLDEVELGCSWSGDAARDFGSGSRGSKVSS